MVATRPLLSRRRQADLDRRALAVRLVTVIVPSWPVTIFCASASPMPVPDFLLVEKSVKSFPRRSAGSRARRPRPGCSARGVVRLSEERAHANRRAGGRGVHGVPEHDAEYLLHLVPVEWARARAPARA
jgi:hypothetical protein